MALHWHPLTLPRLAFLIPELGQAPLLLLRRMGTGVPLGFGCGGRALSSPTQHPLLPVLSSSSRIMLTMLLPDLQIGMNPVSWHTIMWNVRVFTFSSRTCRRSRDCLGLGGKPALKPSA